MLIEIFAQSRGNAGVKLRTSVIRQPDFTHQDSANSKQRPALMLDDLLVDRTGRWIGSRGNGCIGSTGSSQGSARKARFNSYEAMPVAARSSGLQSIFGFGRRRRGITNFLPRHADTPAWRTYERPVAAFEVDGADMETSVTPNASLIGTISGAPRQIDVLVDVRFENDSSRRIVFDAKRRTRKVDVKEVESFEGMMRDVGAYRWILVCTKGYTEAARCRADQLIDVRIMDEEEALEHDFAISDPLPSLRGFG
jgi:hypothetical protein